VTLTPDTRPPRYDDPGLGLDPTVPAVVPVVHGWLEPGRPGDAYGQLLDSVRSMLDHLAAARPGDATAIEAARQIDDVRDLLAAHAAAEAQQSFGRRPDLPVRGQTLVPPYVVHAVDGDEVRGTVRFGRYHLGRNGAVHGGSIALLCEDLIGQLAIAGGRSFGRAAYTHVDFRSLTPVGTELSFRAWFMAEEGRKRTVRAEIRDGDRVCIEAEGLVVALRPGQH